MPVTEATLFTDVTSPISHETTEVFHANTVNLDGNEVKEFSGVPGIPFEETTIANECPPPQICGTNCGVYIDEKGCQTCQCLWLGIRE